MELVASREHTCASTETCQAETCDDEGLPLEEAWIHEDSMVVCPAIPSEMSADDAMTSVEVCGLALGPCGSLVACVRGDCGCDRCGDQEADVHTCGLHSRDDLRAMDFLQSPYCVQDSEE